MAGKNNLIKTQIKKTRRFRCRVRLLCLVLVLGIIFCTLPLVEKGIDALCDCLQCCSFFYYGRSLFFFNTVGCK